MNRTYGLCISTYLAIHTCRGDQGDIHIFLHYSDIPFTLHSSHMTHLHTSVCAAQGICSRRESSTITAGPDQRALPLGHTDQKPACFVPLFHCIALT